jgi:hypothetical protein
MMDNSAMTKGSIAQVGASLGPAVSAATAAAIMGPTYRTAINMAMYLDQVRQVYGDECANFIAKAWLASPNPSWEEVSEAALLHWTKSHPRPVLDLDM